MILINKQNFLSSVVNKIYILNNRHDGLALFSESIFGEKCYIDNYSEQLFYEAIKSLFEFYSYQKKNSPNFKNILFLTLFCFTLYKMFDNMNIVLITIRL